MKASRTRGFTLVEVMISVVAAAVLLALATPSFTEFTKNKRITTQANEFISSLALARSEALKRVERVTVCSSPNGTTCASSGNWNQGYIVFNDKNNNGQVNPTGDPNTNEAILKVVSALAGANTLDGSSTVAAYVSYVSSGHSRTTGGAFQSGTIALCDDRGAAHGKEISVSVTGRVRVETGAPASCTP